MPRRGALDFPAGAFRRRGANGDAHFRRVPGGVELDGTWGFASGIDCATWNDFTVFLPREQGAEQGAPEHFFALVPKSDIEVLDDRDSTGLRGTGSHSVRVTAST